MDAGAHVLAIKRWLDCCARRPLQRLAPAPPGAVADPFTHPTLLPRASSPALRAAYRGRHLCRRAAAERPAASIVAAAVHTEYDTGPSLAVCALEPYWRRYVKVYAPFESAGAGGFITREAAVQPCASKQLFWPGDQIRRDRKTQRAPTECWAGVTPTSKVVGDRRWHWSAPVLPPIQREFVNPGMVLGFLRRTAWTATVALAGRAARPTGGGRDCPIVGRLGCQATLNRLLFPQSNKGIHATGKPTTRRIRRPNRSSMVWVKLGCG